MLYLPLPLYACSPFYLLSQSPLIGSLHSLFASCPSHISYCPESSHSLFSLLSSLIFSFSSLLSFLFIFPLILLLLSYIISSSSPPSSPHPFCTCTCTIGDIAGNNEAQDLMKLFKDDKDNSLRPLAKMLSGRL